MGERDLSSLLSHCISTMNKIIKKRIGICTEVVVTCCLSAHDDGRRSSALNQGKADHKSASVKVKNAIGCRYHIAQACPAPRRTSRADSRRHLVERAESPLGVAAFQEVRRFPNHRHSCPSRHGTRRARLAPARLGDVCLLRSLGPNDDRPLDPRTGGPRYLPVGPTTHLPTKQSVQLASV